MKDDSNRGPKNIKPLDQDEENSSSFGDTQGLDGFLRLVQFIKKEHQRKQQVKIPEFQLRKMRIEQYSSLSQQEALRTTSGTQLKKAA